MNKKLYKDAFSKIQPSVTTTERIMEMTNKKHCPNIKRVIACVAVIAMLLCVLGVVANAATDGAITETIAEVAQNISKKVYVFVNGEKAEADVTIEEHTDGEGNKYFVGEVNVSSPDSDTDTKIEFKCEGDDGDSVLSAGEIDIILTDNIEEAFVPTTTVEE